MHQPSEIFKIFQSYGFNFYSGVPDSLLKDFCAYITDNASEKNHVIAANEGNAIGLAAGHFLSTGNCGLVYMQNSGLGNAINPLLSLADPEVYSIPMLLMIGWRGEPNTKDEPQHLKQGRITTNLLDAMEIPWFELSARTIEPEIPIRQACELMKKKSMPVALLISKNTFVDYELKNDYLLNFPMTREDSVKCVVNSLKSGDILISTTGMISREVYEYRNSEISSHGVDFLTVGSMGHASSIAMGVALTQDKRKVTCLDGDGSLIMHMGAMAILGQSKLPNLIHIVINNGSHDSVGGQPTVGLNIDLCLIADACGYRNSYSVDSLKELTEKMKLYTNGTGPIFIEIRVRKGARSDLGRPKSTPIQGRDLFMARIKNVESS